MIKILTSRNTGHAHTLWAAAHETPRLKMCPTPALIASHTFISLNHHHTLSPTTA